MRRQDITQALGYSVSDAGFEVAVLVPRDDDDNHTDTVGRRAQRGRSSRAADGAQGNYRDRRSRRRRGW